MTFNVPEKHSKKLLLVFVLWIPCQFLQYHRSQRRHFLCCPKVRHLLLHEPLLSRLIPSLTVTIYSFCDIPLLIAVTHYPLFNLFSCVAWMVFFLLERATTSSRKTLDFSIVWWNIETTTKILWKEHNETHFFGDGHFCRGFFFKVYLLQRQQLTRLTFFQHGLATENPTWSITAVSS